MIQVTVRLFAVARDIIGFDKKKLSLPHNAKASTVIDSLVHDHPRFNEWKDHCRLAVNCEYVQSNHPLNDGDEIAVIPPVSGG